MSVERLRFMAHIKLHCYSFWKKKMYRMQIHLFNSILGWNAHQENILKQFLSCGWTKQALSSMLNWKIDVYYFACSSFLMDVLFHFTKNFITFMWNTRKISFNCLLCCRSLHFVIRNLSQKLRWQLDKHIKRAYNCVSTV